MDRPISNSRSSSARTRAPDASVVLSSSTGIAVAGSAHMPQRAASITCCSRAVRLTSSGGICDMLTFPESIATHQL
jgi:hypothetical protein